MWKRSLFVLFLGLLPLWLQAADDSLVVYSGRKDKFVKPVVEAFTKETGIKVVIHSGSSTSLLNKLKLEGPRTTADLFISNDAGNLQKGSELGLFSAVAKEVADVIPANYRAPDNTWIGLSARARVLVVSTKTDDAAFVKSVFDLADPRLKGKLAITHSGNESYIAGVSVYMQAKGEEKTRTWLKGMKDNVSGSVFNKHSKIVKAVASGKKSVGLVNHYYIYRHLEKNPKAAIKIVLPDQDKQGMGVAWNVAGIAVSRYSKNTDKVTKFLNFLVSKQGQTKFARVNREYPTRPDVAASNEIPKLNSFKVADVPMVELGRKRIATLDLIESAGMP